MCVYPHTCNHAVVHQHTSDACPKSLTYCTGICSTSRLSTRSTFSYHQDTSENRKKGARRPDRQVIYTVVIKLSRGGDTAMRVLGRNAVEYEAAPGTGVCFRSELWHKTERASEGTMKVTLFFGRWLK